MFTKNVPVKITTMITVGYQISAMYRIWNTPVVGL